MQKKNNLLNGLLLALIFVVVAVMLYLSLTGKVEMSTGIVIMIVSVVAIAVVLYLLNAKNSAYGGRFKHNYPDAKNK